MNVRRADVPAAKGADVLTERKINEEITEGHRANHVGEHCGDREGKIAWCGSHCVDLKRPRSRIQSCSPAAFGRCSNSIRGHCEKAQTARPESCRTMRIQAREPFA